MKGGLLSLGWVFDQGGGLGLKAGYRQSCNLKNVILLRILKNMTWVKIPKEKWGHTIREGLSQLKEGEGEEQEYGEGGQGATAVAEVLCAGKI